MDELIKKTVIRTKEFEGFRHEVYKDTVGKATIGYGTNLDNTFISYGIQDLLFKAVRDHVNNGGLIGNNWIGLRLASGTAEKILILDLEERWKEILGALPFAESLPETAQEILLDMCYNLGLKRLLGFKRFLKALQAGIWVEAAREMLDSRWARQVKRRATTQADEIRGLA